MLLANKTAEVSLIFVIGSICYWRQRHRIQKTNSYIPNTDRLNLGNEWQHNHKYDLMKQKRRKAKTQMERKRDRRNKTVSSQMKRN